MVKRIASNGVMTEGLRRIHGLEDTWRLIRRACMKAVEAVLLYGMVKNDDETTKSEQAPALNMQLLCDNTCNVYISSSK